MNNTLLFILILVFVFLGFKVRSLTFSGAISACIIAIFITIGLHIEGIILLGIFFATSSFWSKYKGKQKKTMEDIVEKGDQRDYAQVLANGSLPALFSLLYWLFPSDYWLLSFCISIAAANADTWASEIGSLSKKLPIHVLTLKIVPAGTSGAISILGSIATLFGALIIALSSYILFDQLTLQTVLIITAVGSLGSLVDTIIGATIQAKYKCAKCHVLTEKLKHCHDDTKLVSGKAWMNNDKTNFLSIMIATLIGLLINLLLNISNG
ncbi:DUF92 domain-containing protein [Bacillus sp. DJP31]|uniref:DUF92 domain-containing protein n=1 Tax=Bacillus sp. DJP31 TaxID=3409789 RepID=UPI003BB7C19B